MINCTTCIKGYQTHLNICSLHRFDLMHNLYKKLPNTSKYMLFIFIFLSTKSNAYLFVASKLQQLNNELDARDGNYTASNRKTECI
jgi:hypothetical protein